MNEVTKERIIDMVEGNPGAIRALMEAIQQHDPETVLKPLEDAGVRGPGIWILFKDRAGCDVGKFMDLLLSPPAPLAELASERTRLKPEEEGS